MWGFLTENLDVDGGLGVALLGAADHTLVDAGVVDVGVVDGERGRGVIVAHHRDALLARAQPLPVRGEPRDVLGPGLPGHCRAWAETAGSDRPGLHGPKHRVCLNPSRVRQPRTASPQNTGLG